MFDFRYHALSLVAVFIALLVGLLLGVAIGDQQLVSSAKRDVRESLRNDVRRANRDRDSARAALTRERRFVEEAYPILTSGQLRGRSIGLVLLGAEAPAVVKSVRDALEPTGARIRLVAVVR
ncbi:MAG: copper transporter, partial [Actinomycetota bacterium]|nr:copper transporter [Actinomycetota bacterium]